MRNLLPADRVVNLLVWAVLGVALAAWQTRSVVTHRTAGLTDVVRLARRRLVTRWAMLAGWAWIGWHLFVRTSF